MSVHALPVELYERMFLLLDVHDLLRAAHVCRHWRALAFSNSAYWAQIRVDDVSPGVLDLAEHRAMQGGGKPVDLTIDHTQPPRTHDDPVLKRVLPLLRLLLSRLWRLCLTIESQYRSYVEDVLCGAAPHLRCFYISYAAEPLPDLPFRLPLGYNGPLFAGLTGSLKVVQLWDVVLPETPIAAFINVDEVWWMKALSTGQADFPCYLFDFFPNCTRLRMAGGTVQFSNVPLPRAVVEKFRTLKWVDIEFPIPNLPAFFGHLPLDELGDLTVRSPDEDYVYRTLKPLIRLFHVDFRPVTPDEFLLSVKGSNSARVRRFAEPLRYYSPGSTDINPLLENNAFFAEQVTALSIHLSLWSRLKPWLQSSYPATPRLILTLDVLPGLTARLPEEDILFPALKTLVLQAPSEFVCVDVDDLVAFADRLTAALIALELRHVLTSGSQDILAKRFVSIESLTSLIEV